MEAERILGQNHIQKHFQNAIRLGKISHAYIINGEAGSGKMMLAKQFAKALQCESNGAEVQTRTGTACGHCKSCHQVDTGNQPDIKYITHEKTGIGVDEIREQLNDDIIIKPYSNRYKIYIVDESEKLTVQAQNALLKTIEEPPEYAIILLLTTNADLFLPTILSRCVLLNVRPVREEAIRNQLMADYGVGDYEARVAAAFSNGNPGKAVKLATSEEFRDMKQQVVSAMTRMANGGMDMIATAIKDAGQFKKQMEEYFSLIRIWFRDMLIYKATMSEERLIFQDDYQAIEKMCAAVSFNDIDMILKSIDQAERRIHSNVNFDATMEVLFLAIKERMQK